MTFTPGSATSVDAFIGILGLVILSLLGGLYWSVAQTSDRKTAWAWTRRVGLATFIWLGLIVELVRSGFIEANIMPMAIIFLVGSNIAAVILAFSRVGEALMRLPLWALVGFQAFRLPLELVLHDWVGNGTIPRTMTWDGQNWDIVSGILALICAPFPKLAWVFNVIGLLLLANVARVAVLSSPLPFGWGVEPRLQLAFHLPYALIVPVCVAGALAGHLILTRKLRSGSS